MHRVVTQQMGVGLHRSEVVDGDNVEVLAARLINGADNVAADAAKAVDGDAGFCHGKTSGADDREFRAPL